MTERRTVNLRGDFQVESVAGDVIFILGGEPVLTMSVEEARTLQAIGLPAVLPHRQTNPQHPQTCLPDVHPDT